MSKVNHAGTSEQGNVRFKNEDAIAHTIPDDLATINVKGHLFIIADGVGGTGAGDVASSEAVKIVTDTYYSTNARPDKCLKNAFQKANLHVFDLGIEKHKLRMQTTMSAIAIVGATAYISHVGDTRIYRVRTSNRIEQITQDDSEVAELVRMHILNPENAKHHPRRNIITRSIGSEPVVKVASIKISIEPGDKFVLCTDGLWEPIEDLEIADIVANNDEELACSKLIKLALDRQATDNLSLQIINVLDVSEELAPEPAAKETWWHLAYQKISSRFQHI